MKRNIDIVLLTYAMHSHPRMAEIIIKLKQKKGAVRHLKASINCRVA